MQADTTQLVLLIALVFAYGLVSCAQQDAGHQRRDQSGAEPDATPARASQSYLESIQGHDAQSRAICASALKIKLASRIASIRHIANSLVLLGLLGTVIGFIMALSGVDAQAAGDVELDRADGHDADRRHVGRAATRRWSARC